MKRIEKEERIEEKAKVDEMRCIKSGDITFIELICL